MDSIRTKDQYRDNLLVDYLLGKLSPAEETKIEQDFVADAGLQDKLVQVEDELVDRYLEGQLSQDERQQLEARFLASARGRRKLEIARSLAAVATEAARKETGTQSSAGSVFLRRPMQIAAAAVVLVLLLMLGWFVRERAIRGNRQNQIISPARKPESLPGPAQSSQTGSIATIVLQPVSRDIVQSPEAKLDPGTDQLRIHLELNGNHKTYVARLLSADGKEKWAAQGLQSQPASSGQELVLIFSADAFENGEYTILLVSNEDPTMPIAEYSFVVRKLRDRKAKD